jgi:hypothetical protein
MALDEIFGHSAIFLPLQNSSFITCDFILVLSPFSVATNDQF